MTLPRAAEWLLAVAAPEDLREAVTGDFAEWLGGEERRLGASAAQSRLWPALFRGLPGLLAIRWERLHEARRPPAFAFWLLGFVAVAVVHRLHDLARALVPMREGTAVEPGWMAAALAAASLAGVLAGCAGLARARVIATLTWIPLALTAVALSSASYPALYVALLVLAPPALALAGAVRRGRSSLL